MTDYFDKKHAKYKRAEAAALEMLQAAIKHNLSVEETHIAAEKVKTLAMDTPTAFPPLPEKRISDDVISNADNARTLLPEGDYRDPEQSPVKLTEAAQDEA